MDPLAPHGLAPAGPGAVGAPLVDWILSNPGLAGAVLSHLAPRDVLGLRAASKATCAAVAGHPWSLPATGVGAHLARSSHVVTGATALRRWRACYPRARRLEVYGDKRAADDWGLGGGGGSTQAGADEVTDADVAAHCAGVATLSLHDCRVVTDAALAGLSPAELIVADTRGVTGAGWAHMTGLRRLAVFGTGPVTDAHLVPLGAARTPDVFLRTSGCSVTDAGVAAHLRHVRRLTLTVAAPTFTGAGLRGCAQLRELQLRNPAWPRQPADHRPRLAADALAGCARTLSCLELHGVDVTDGALAGLAAVEHAHLTGVPRLTDEQLRGLPGLRSLEVAACGGFAGGVALPALPRLSSLTVVACGAFTGAGLGGGTVPALRSLEVARCGSFTPAALQAGRLPALREVTLEELPGLTDASLRAAGAAALACVESLDVRRCPEFEGRRLGRRALPALTFLNVQACDGLVGSGLGALRALAQLWVDDCGGFTADALGAVGARTRSLECVSYVRRDVAPGGAGALTAAAAAAALGGGWRVSGDGDGGGEGGEVSWCADYEGEGDEGEGDEGEGDDGGGDGAGGRGVKRPREEGGRDGDAGGGDDGSSGSGGGE